MMNLVRVGYILCNKYMHAYLCVCLCVCTSVHMWKGEEGVLMCNRLPAIGNVGCLLLVIFLSGSCLIHIMFHLS